MAHKQDWAGPMPAPVLFLTEIYTSPRNCFSCADIDALSPHLKITLEAALCFAELQNRS